MICWLSSGSISNQMSPVVYEPPTSVRSDTWTSTVCETEIGYRRKAYTIYRGFARAFLVKNFTYFIFLCILYIEFG
jgi:hypothetical protein